MSRTIRRTYRNFFRRPRGRVKAILAGVKSSKIPPDEWEDLQAGARGEARKDMLMIAVFLHRRKAMKK